MRFGQRVFMRSFDMREKMKIALRDSLPKLYLAAALFLSGCSAFTDAFDSTQPSNRPPGHISRDEEIAQTPLRRRAEGIEVTWQVPSEPVDGFVIRYGYDRTHLDSESKVSVSLLTPEKDPEFGPVFRFIIPGVKPDATVFVSVAAFRGERVSDFSEVSQESLARNARH
jgi:hypothetical protein